MTNVYALVQYMGNEVFDIIESNAAEGLIIPVPFIILTVDSPKFTPVKFRTL